MSSGEECHLAIVGPAGSDEMPGSRDVTLGVAWAGPRVTPAEYPAGRAGVVDAVGNARRELEYLDLEHVARFGPLDRNRPGNDMAAPALSGPFRP